MDSGLSCFQGLIGPYWRVTVAADGALAPALDALYSAAAALIDEAKQMVDGKILVADSLYQQLTDAIPGQFLGRSSGAAHSQPPLWIDAEDLLTTIDSTVRSWQPEHPYTV